MTESKYLDTQEESQEGSLASPSPLASLTSRRGFLAGSAALLAGGAIMGLPGVASAHETSDPPTDVDVLNFALSLEHLEYAFYRDGLQMFDEKDFQRSNFSRGWGNEIRKNVYEYFEIIREHEDTHVDTLTSVISDLGGVPVPECTYNFESTAFTSVEHFISVAQFLENTGVTAYDGAIAHIESAGLLTAGATIATVEARHASYLNLLNRDIPFPDAFDNPVAPRDICNAIKAENGGFVVSCPEPYGPYSNLDELCERLPTTTS